MLRRLRRGSLLLKLRIEIDPVFLLMIRAFFKIFSYIGSKRLLMFYRKNGDITVKKIVDGLKGLCRFNKIQVKRNTILIAEPLTYHAETIPGFNYLFNEIGYDIVILASMAVANSDVFSRHNQKTKPIIIGMPAWAIAACIRRAKKKGFQLIFNNSAVYGNKTGYWGYFVDYVNTKISSQLPFINVEHDICASIEKFSPTCEYLKTSVHLTGYEIHGCATIPMVAPCYFGIAHPKIRSNKVCFCVVGALSKIGPTLKLLEAAVQELTQEGVFNYEVNIIGKRDIQTRLDEYKNVTLHGSVSFEVMYALLENSDYILYMLDSSNDSHLRYANGVVSGARQLSFGFELIPIIEKLFANAYNINESFAIIYESQKDFSASLRKAIGYSIGERLRMVKCLRHERNRVLEISLSNLMTIINRAEKS